MLWYFDLMDECDQTIPRMFSCELCGGEMYPENYNQFDKKSNYLCNANDKI